MIHNLDFLRNLVVHLLLCLLDLLLDFRSKPTMAIHIKVLSTFFFSVLRVGCVLLVREDLFSVICGCVLCCGETLRSPNLFFIF